MNNFDLTAYNLKCFDYNSQNTIFLAIWLLFMSIIYINVTNKYLVYLPFGYPNDHRSILFDLSQVFNIRSVRSFIQNNYSVIVSVFYRLFNQKKSLPIYINCFFSKYDCEVNYIEVVCFLKLFIYGFLSLILKFFGGLEI